MSQRIENHDFRITVMFMGEETLNGQPVTDEAVQEWADEAESSYEVETLRKRGRPTVGDGPGAIVPVRMDEALLAALNARAEQEHVSRSEAIREAVRTWAHIA